MGVCPRRAGYLRHITMISAAASRLPLLGYFARHAGLPFDAMKVTQWADAAAGARTRHSLGAMGWRREIKQDVESMPTP